MAKTRDYLSAKEFLNIGKSIKKDIMDKVLPADEGVPSKSQSVLARSLTRNTRGYIERVVEQINSSYENGNYDACNVMIRRLLETLIIEAFESKNLHSKIKDVNGNFYYLSELIIKLENEPIFSISRNGKKSLKILKDVGDKSAHNRRFLSHRSDIDDKSSSLRDIVQELLIVSGIK
jgi:hypothetical protein